MKREDLAVLRERVAALPSVVVTVERDVREDYSAGPLKAYMPGEAKVTVESGSRPDGYVDRAAVLSLIDEAMATLEGVLG